MVVLLLPAAAIPPAIRSTGIFPGRHRLHFRHKTPGKPYRIINHRLSKSLRLSCLSSHAEGFSSHRIPTVDTCSIVDGLVEKLRAWKCFLPGGNWWLLRGDDDGEEGEGRWSNGVTVVQALERMWFLVSGGRVVICLAFASLFIASKFEPGYTATPPKPRMIDVVITIRGSLEAAGAYNEPQNPTTVLITGDQQELEDAVYVPVPVRENSCVHQVALMFTIVFFLRQLVIILFFSGESYATTLATAFVIRSACVLLPSYLLVRLISVIRRARRRHYIHEITEVTTIYHDTV